MKPHISPLTNSRQFNIKCRLVVCSCLISFLALVQNAYAASHAAGFESNEQEELSLENYMQRVVEYNYSVQARLLGFHAARRMRAAEMGAFEPSVVTSGQFMDTQRPLTTQIERATGLSSLLGQQDVFMERNKNYSSALEMLTPSGARMRVGVTARQLDNNLDDSQSLIQGTEYETGAGISPTFISLHLSFFNSTLTHFAKLVQVQLDAMK